MITDFEASHKGLREMTMGPEFRSFMVDQAELVRAVYRENVAHRSGQLAREVRVESFIGGRRMDRWCARVVAYAPYAAAHEFGTSGQRGYHELAHALEAVVGK